MSKQAEEMLSDKKRITLIFLWSILTLLAVYFVLYLGLIVMGEKAASDLIIGNIYTLAPGTMAIIFILFFKTEDIGNLWKQFEYPKIKWILLIILKKFLIR